VTSTHTSVNNYVMTPRRAMDVVKWHSTQMAVAVSHLYTSLESMIAPMLPSLKPDFVWIFADDLYIVHNGLLPSIEVPIHWHQHCHHTHVSGEAVQAVQTLTNDLRMQTRSLAEWEPTGKIVLQTCQHISLALIGLLFPCAVTVAIQAIHLVTLTSTTLLQLTMQLTAAVPRMQCSVMYYLKESLHYVDSKFRPAHGPTQFLIFLCDALMICLSTGLDVREVQLYMSAMETICIVGLMIGILILHLMSKYEDLLMHATWNNQRTRLRKFDHPKCANGKYWSRIRYFQRKFIKHQAEHSTAQNWLHQSRECVKTVISGLCKMLLAPFKIIARCISGLCKMLLAPLKLIARCISGLCKMLLAPLKLVGRCICALCKMLLAPLKLVGRCIWRSKDDTQTAHADSQHCDPKGGNSNEVNQRGLQAQQAHGTTGLYMEHQVRKFCQVHALNAMLGRNAIQLETMLKFCEEHGKDDTALGRNLRLGIGWCSRD